MSQSQKTPRWRPNPTVVDKAPITRLMKSYSHQAPNLLQASRVSCPHPLSMPSIHPVLIYKPFHPNLHANFSPSRFRKLGKTRFFLPMVVEGTSWQIYWVFCNLVQRKLSYQLQIFQGELLFFLKQLLYFARWPYREGLFRFSSFHEGCRKHCTGHTCARLSRQLSNANTFLS